MLVAHSESIRIRRPVAAVWRLVGDPTAWEEWAGLADVETHGGLDVGGKITYRHGGAPQDVVLTAYDAERELAIRRTTRSYEMRESIVLTGDRDATTVSIAMAFEPRALWARALAPFVTPFRRILLGRPLARSLQALRLAAEHAEARD